MIKRWVLVIATVVVYANSLSNPFVFDDQGAIVENETIRTLSPITTALAPARQSATAGRPLVNLSLAINYAAAGLSPWGYRAWNLSVHILCGLLLFGIVRRTLALRRTRHTAAAGRPVASGGKRGRGPRAADPEVASSPAADTVAFICALIWLLHPLQTELIDYLIQRTESMMALAYFATLYSAIRAMTTRQPAAWTIAAIAACTAGMMCKESMVTAPIMVLLFDMVFVAGTLDGPRPSLGLRPASTLLHALKSRPVLYAGLAASWIVLAFMIAGGPRSHSAGFSAGISAWTYLLNQAPIIARYLRTAIWPASLVFDYGTPRPLTLTAVLVPGGAVVALLLATIWAWRAHRWLAFLGTWLFVTLAPSSSFVPIVTEVGAERRMYLPLAAIVVATVVAVSRVVGAQRWLPTGAAILAVGLGGLTIRRNAEYSSGMRLWQTVVDRYPHGRAHYSVGMALKLDGRLPEAMREFETASEDYPEADYAIGFERANEGRHAEALTHLQRYVKARPDDLNVIRAYNLIGRSQLITRAFEEAVASFREVRRMQPRNVDALGGLADALLALDRPDDALAAYQEYVRLVSGNVKAWVNLGLVLARRERHAEAIDAFTAAIALDPRAPGPHVNLASSLAALGRFDDAIAECRRAVAFEPDPAGRAEIESLIRLIAADKEKGARP